MITIVWWNLDVTSTVEATGSTCASAIQCCFFWVLRSKCFRSGISWAPSQSKNSAVIAQADSVEFASEGGMHGLLQFRKPQQSMRLRKPLVISIRVVASPVQFPEPLSSGGYNDAPWRSGWAWCSSRRRSPASQWRGRTVRHLNLLFMIDYLVWGRCSSRENDHNRMRLDHTP